MPITSSKMFLRDFAVQANIGIHAFEKTGPQRLLISVDLEVDITDESGKDDIGTVLDYDFLRREIMELVSCRRFSLQETLCREIVGIVASHDAVIAATVSTRKPDVYPDCAAVGVELTYRR
jgi:7,8-dihydroneopterin aldolase/epimerase/oxygenase